MFLEFVVDNWLLFAAFALVCALLVWNLFGDRFKGIRAIDVAEMVTLINNESAVVIDVRSDAEFNNGHILNSVNVPASELTGRMNSLKSNQEHPHVVVCETGNAAAKPCSQLKENGFSQVYRLAGGLAAWKDQNYPLHK